MFIFKINEANATITAKLVDGKPGPSCLMYYPHGAVVETLEDSFTVDGKLYTPYMTEEKGQKFLFCK